MGFSRQEYWSGVPLPSPCLVTQLCPTLCFLWTVARGILKARILEWVAMPSSRGSSQSRDQTRVSHTAGGFFTRRATREAQINTLVDNLLKINSIKNCTYFIHQRISCFISQVISFIMDWLDLRTSLVAQTVKRLCAVWETRV